MNWNQRKRGEQQAGGIVCAPFNDEKAKQVIIVKVAIVGDSYVGKTTLMVKYIEDKYNEEFMETFGLNVLRKSFELKNCIADLQIYDLGGRQYAQLMPTALQGTKAVIFTFSLIQKQSLISIKRWYKDARKLNKVFKPILVGAKYDLFEQKDSSYKLKICEMARAYAENMRAPFIMCSSTKTTNIKQVFTIVVGSVFQIKIKSKPEHSIEEPILEYDVIYKKHRNKHKKAKHKKYHNKKKQQRKNKKQMKNNHKDKDYDKSSSSDSDDSDEKDNNKKDNNDNNDNKGRDYDKLPCSDCDTSDPDNSDKNNPKSTTMSNKKEDEKIHNHNKDHKKSPLAAANSDNCDNFDEDEQTQSATHQEKNI